MEKMVLSLEVNKNSELFNIDELLNCFSYCTNTNWHYRLNEHKYYLERNLKGIYFLYNNDKEIIYIGKTSNCIRQRLKEHLYLDIYRGLDYYNLKRMVLKRKQSVYFSYIEVEKNLIDCVEILLINKYKPKYNVQFNNQ
jgi:hypothetical protein